MPRVGRHQAPGLKRLTRPLGIEIVQGLQSPKTTVWYFALSSSEGHATQPRYAA